LLADIVYSKPAFNLQEGVFFDKISGFTIKVGKKEANDSVIKDVIVYEQGNPLQDNFMIAKSGIMRVSENKRFLEFNLKDGWRYQERGNSYSPGNSEYIRTGFKEYKKQFDLSSLGFGNRTADSVNKNNERMYSMRQLRVAIDSLKKELRVVRIQVMKDVFRQYTFTVFLDTLQKTDFKKSIAMNRKVKSFDEILPDSARENVNQSIQNIAGSLKLNLESFANTINDKERSLRKHQIEWHRKIVLSLACLVLFLVGAPLGSIIRKGGLGTPLIFAIGFFMLFYFSSTTGEKFAKENSLTPFTGMWLATFILVPIGLFLTYKAMMDSKLFNKDRYKAFFRFGKTRK
jgi:lipopolysaccharide export system permease protein